MGRREVGVTGSTFPLLGAPPPVVALDRAAAVLERHWGIVGALAPLESQQDRNLRVDAATDGRDGRWVLRFDHPATPRRELGAQDAVLEHLAGTLTGAIEVPRPVAALAGDTTVDVVLDGDVPGTARLLTWVDGEALSGVARPSRALVRQVGEACARVTAALEAFDHPGAHRVCQWDLARADALVAAVRPSLDPALGARVDAALQDTADRVAAVAGRLPVGVVHGDLHPDNLLVRPGPDGVRRVTGLIDVGDLMVAWRVSELVVAVAGLVVRDPARATTVLREVVTGAVRAGTRLADEEAAALWPLVRRRLAVEAAAAAHQAVLEPANAYARAQLPRLAAALDATARLPITVMTAAVRAAADRAEGPVVLPVPTARVADWLPEHPGRHGRVLDLGPTSTLLTGDAWQDARHVAAAVDAAAGDDVPVARWREARLTATAPPGPDAPATVHLGVDLVVPAGTAVAAPFAARVTRVAADRVVLAPDAADDAAPAVLVAGLVPAVAAGTDLAAGAHLGVVAARADRPGGSEDRDGAALGPWACADRLPPHLHLQVLRDPDVDAPALTTGDLAAAWAERCPDPSALVGLDVAAPPDGAVTLARRRDAVLARAQERYYDEPPRIERGNGAWLVDMRGRALLDVVNNVAAVGHSHPRVTAAVAHQLALLNTNSRFLYEPMVAFAERLVALLPAPLDTVFLVNSGSEAVEVALRLARIATGRRDVVCLAGAYHGWTTATDEITTPVLGRDKPIEPWVHPLEAPYLHRGPYGPASGGTVEERAARLTAAAVARVRSLAGAGTPPAALVTEAFLGNAGGIALPPGYLAAVAAAVRDVGGLVVADEVQVGYGRTGATFWAFEAEGVVPDVVTMAKMVGNGLPVAAAVTTRAVAEAFARHDAFFSSSGGSPVGCAAGLAVLDVLEDEGLMANAAAVGARLSAALGALAVRHPVIGAVHGKGLYQGVELVLDRATMAPAPAVARLVCERLLELGVVCQPTGEHGNVLKVKPPLVITAAEADAFVAALDRTLAEGW